MLNGIDPIIIFQFYKVIPKLDFILPAIPLISASPTKSTFAIIPIYLSENLTGIFIDTESKSIEIDTTMDASTEGGLVGVTQKPLSSVTSINLIAKQGSIGLTILLALSELILDKTQSQEYEVTYMNGAVTVFGGLIDSFSFEQGRMDDLYKIKVDLSRGRPTPAKELDPVANNPLAERAGVAGATPPPLAPTPPGATSAATAGQSQIRPGVTQARP